MSDVLYVSRVKVGKTPTENHICEPLLYTSWQIKFSSVPRSRKYERDVRTSSNVTTAGRLFQVT